MTEPIRAAIVGTWGIPAKYGGFETLAEQLARNLDPEEVRFTIYGQKSAFTAAEREGDFAGHTRIWLPLSAKGPQSMLHDALQIFRAVFVDGHDRLLLLGTSGAWALPVVRLFRPGIRVVSNIDGLEWRREKFGRAVRFLLKWLEKIAVRNSDFTVADNDALVPLVRDLHTIEPVMIAYGGDQIRLPEGRLCDPAGHLLAIARVEPENNGAMILEGVRQAGESVIFLGNWDATSHGRELQQRFGAVAGLTLHRPIYDQQGLAELRAGSRAYLHGHSVGGTNPSLVEALFHSERILAFDCAFNRATLDGHGAYFGSSEALADLLRTPDSGRIPADALAALRARYRWRSIALAYLELLHGRRPSTETGQTGQEDPDRVSATL